MRGLLFPRLSRNHHCTVWITGCRPTFRALVSALALAFALHACVGSTAEKFTVATLNLENYCPTPGGARPVKSAESRAKIRESILAMRPDVIGLQEVAGPNALQELRSALKADGLEYPHWEHVTGFDTNIQVAVLSRFPIAARHPHSKDGFLLNGRRLRLTRGIAELDIQVNPSYTFTLLVAHLKSKRPAAIADQADIREQEAIVLREKVEARLRSSPTANVVVVGDLNDVKDAISTRTVIGKGTLSLVDTRPAERNGDPQPTAASRSPRNVAWTHFYSKECRLDT